MPLPTPKEGESKKDFVARCMGDATMSKEYPDQSQRYAVCNAQFGGVRGNEEQKTLHSHIFTLKAVSHFEELDGKKHIVFPTVLMTPGVFNNVHYPASELSRYPEAWNGRPVCVRHPKNAEGHFVSCNSPEYIQKQTVGMLFNVRWENERLKGDVWINVEKANAIFPSLIDTIRTSKMEVSTGLFGDDDNVEGSMNGVHYNTTCYNHRPDHFALLPDEKGACSWEDGAGIPRINSEEEGSKMVKTSSSSKKNETNPDEEDVSMKDRKEKVDELLKTHSEELKDIDRSVLESMDQKVFDVFVNSLVSQKQDAKKEEEPKTPLKRKEEPKANTEETKQTVSFEQLLEAAPDQYKQMFSPESIEMFQTGIKAHNDMKADLIAKIKANSKNQFSDEWLSTQKVDVLKGIANFAEMDEKRPDFSGRGILKSNAGVSVEIEPLPSVTLSFDKEGK